MKFFYNLLDGFEEPNRFYDEQTIRRFRVYPATPEIEKEAYENSITVEEVFEVEN